MSSRYRLGVSRALYLKPLLAGLGRREMPFDVMSDHPATLAYEMNEHTGRFQCAFLSPIDYGRRGGDFRIVPGVAVSSSSATGTARLFVNPQVRNISTVAVDLRITSDIILARIILSERYPNLPSETSRLRYIPMMPDLPAMLARADAAVLGHADATLPQAYDIFHLDLVQEWWELTGLPYVHGMWVAREEGLTDDVVRALLASRDAAPEARAAIAREAAAESGAPLTAVEQYLAAFSYELDDTGIESLEEFFHYAFYLGILPDKPDLNFYGADGSSEQA
jgi:chorismate dehydratase